MKSNDLKRRNSAIATALLASSLSGCAMSSPWKDKADLVIPAEEFTKSARTGDVQEYSIYRAAHRIEEERRARLAEPASDDIPVAKGVSTEPKVNQANAERRERAANRYQGDERYLNQGYALKRSVGSSQPVHERTPEPRDTAELSDEAEIRPTGFAGVPPGSRAPYMHGQMTANPSLWPDEGQAAALFRDFRAYEPMDVITILINESTEGNKKAETDAKAEYTLTAAISNFFGIETKDWASNNEGLDPSALINAETSSDFKGEGETKRKGTMKARLSAVIMEVLPNGLLRIEGTKIVSVDNEEEVMVLSGLVRQRDVDAANQVDSSRIANMRIDLYGKGIIADQTTYGWLAKIIRWVWPF